VIIGLIALVIFVCFVVSRHKQATQDAQQQSLTHDESQDETLNIPPPEAGFSVPFQQPPYQPEYTRTAPPQQPEDAPPPYSLHTQAPYSQKGKKYKQKLWKEKTRFRK